MSDLVERWLKVEAEACGDAGCHPKVCVCASLSEAIQEIERLRAANRALVEAAGPFVWFERELDKAPVREDWPVMLLQSEDGQQETRVSRADLRALARAVEASDE